MAKRIAVLVLILLTVACHKNPYNQFYNPSDLRDVQVEPLKEGQVPLVIHSNDLRQDVDELLAKSYVQIGSASFDGGSANEYNAVAQAYWVSATAVIIPLTGNAAVYFAKRSNSPRVGIIFRDLTNQDKKAIECNWGAFVRSVVEDTPAFYANILPGDVVIEISGNSIRNADSAYNALKQIEDSKGSIVAIKLIRNKSEREITIKF
jgi:S1-C subfamily serine protease